MRRVLVLAAISLFGNICQAAEQVIDSSIADAVKRIETTLETESLTANEFAETDRFAIFYVLRPNQSTLTITASQLPQQTLRTTLSVSSDSPQDELLEKRFLEKLMRTKLD